ncbi:MAG: CPBP family intramembrane glutamic endopeptidase [Draconibacterium sp.]
MKKAIQLIFKFLLNPVQESFSEQPVSNKIKWLLFLLVFEMPLMFAAAFLQQLLAENGLLDAENHLVMEFMKDNSKTVIIIFLILVGPFIEELIFRLPLRFKNAYFIPFILIILSYAGSLIFKKLNLSLAVSIPLFVAITAFLIFYIFNRKMAEKRDTALSVNYPLYFYSVTILFALFHLSNYKYTPNLLLFAPIVILPQFISGFLFGFIRIKQGFIWGFFLHALHNAVFVLPLLLLPFSSHPKLIEKIERDDYTFEVYEGFRFNSPEYARSEPLTAPKKITPDEIVLFGKFKDVVANLTFTNKKYISLKNSILAEKEISVFFRNDSAKIESARIASFLVFENLLKSYKLKSKTEKRDIKVWNISVKDRQLFATNCNDSVESTDLNTIHTFYGPKDTLKLQRINSEYLSKTLQIAFDTEIQNDIDKNTAFSINIPNCEFSDLKRFLELNYGLTVEKKTEKRDVLVIY